MDLHSIVVDTGFESPDSIEQAIDILRRIPNSVCLAGGASLVPMMNAGIVRPATLISLRKISGLDIIRIAEDGWLELGAMAKHATVASLSYDTCGFGLLVKAAGQIAHPTVRNMGTIGGSVANGEANADYPCALVGLGAVFRVIGAEGVRDIAAEDFFIAHMKTALRSGEIVLSIRVPPDEGAEYGSYMRFSRVDGDYPMVTLMIRLGFDPDHRCNAARIALGACAPAPFRLANVETMLIGSKLDDDMIEAIARAYAAAAKPISDMKGSAEYKRLMLPGLIVRTLRALRQKAFQNEDCN